MIIATDNALRELLRYSRNLQPGWELGLLKGRRSDDPSDQHRWYLAAYAPEQIQELELRYSSASLALRHTVANVSVLVPQSQLVPELEGGTLEFGAEGFCIVES